MSPKGYDAVHRGTKSGYSDKGGFIMKKLLEFGNRYAGESTWKDFALVKFCLFSMGLIAGIFVPEKHKKTAIGGAAAVFAATYIPLMTKVFRLAYRKD